MPKKRKYIAKGNFYSGDVPYPITAPVSETLNILNNEKNQELNIYVTMKLFSFPYDKAKSSVIEWQNKFANVEGLKDAPWALPFIALIKRDPVLHLFRSGKTHLIVFRNENGTDECDKVPKEAVMHWPGGEVVKDESRGQNLYCYIVSKETAERLAKDPRAHVERKRQADEKASINAQRERIQGSLFSPNGPQ